MDTITSALHYAWPWLAYVALLLIVGAGLFLNILGLPGLWLIVVAAIAYAWAFGFAYIGWGTIIALIVLGLLAELVEFFAGAAGSKQAGGSKRGMVGAIIGGIVGGIVGTPLIPIPIVGTVVGSVAGCFLGAYGIELLIGKSHGEATSISYGAAKGRMVGLIAKTGFGLAMAIVTAVMGAPIMWGRSTSVTTPALPATTTATTQAQ